jgi:hypothetical protein
MSQIPSTSELQEALANLEQYAAKLAQELKGAASMAEDLAYLVREQAKALHVILSAVVEVEVRS